MAKYKIVGEQLDEHGLKVDNCYSVLYGEHQVEHESYPQAIMTCLELRTTGDWEGNPPNYWVEDEDGNDLTTGQVDWCELLAKRTMIKDIFNL